jgi:hypothetical protein
LEIELDSSHFSVQGLESQLNCVFLGCDLANLLDGLQFIFRVELELYESIKGDVRGIDYEFKLLSNHAPVTSSKTLGSQGSKHGLVILAEVLQRFLHELLKLPLLFVLNNKVRLLKSLELIDPLIDLRFNHASVDSFKFFFNPLRKNNIEF